MESKKRNFTGETTNVHTLHKISSFLNNREENQTGLYLVVLLIYLKKIFSCFFINFLKRGL